MDKEPTEIPILLAIHAIVATILVIIYFGMLVVHQPEDIIAVIDKPTVQIND